MMTILTALAGAFRVIENRRQVSALRDLDEHVLADIGLLRADVREALAAPLYRDPSQILKAACCRWRSLASRLGGANEPAACGC